MANEVTSLVLAVDSSQVKTASAVLDEFAQSGKRAEAGADGVQAAAKAIAGTAPATSQAAAALARAQKSSQALGNQQKLTAFQTQQLGYQLNDFFVQIASGQSPLTAMIQQGSQLSGTFGGLRGTFAALRTVLTPITLAFGAVAAVLGTVGLAYYQGAQQTKEFNKSLQLTGNYAGVTADSFNSAAQSIQKFSGGTIGQAREVLQSLVSTGAFGVTSLDSVGAAATRLQRVTGQSTEEIVAFFAKMRNGVADFAVQANKQFNFLTATQFKYIQGLEAQGKSEQASKVAADLLNQALRDRQPQLGTIERLLQSGKEAWSKWWDAALNVGRPQTLQQQLDDVQKRLEAESSPLTLRGGRRRSTQEGIVNGLEGQRHSLEAAQRFEAGQAAADAANAAKNQKEIFEQTAQYQDAQTGITRSGLQTRLELAQQYADQERIYLDRSYDEANLTLAGYERARLVIETQALNAQRDLINAEIELEKKRVIQGSPEDIQLQKVAQQQKLLDLQRQQIPIQTQLFKLQEQYRRGQLLPDSVQNFTAPTPRDDFRAVENAQRQATEQGIAERRLAAMQASSELIQVNKTLGIDLIKDDRARGLAQIAADTEVYEKRLELATLNAEDRKNAEAALADYRLKREKQLTEQLKPEWQRQLENWRDTTKLMKDAADEFGNGLLSTAEDAFVEFAKNGKASIKSLLDFFVAEAAKMTFRSIAGQLSGGGAGDLFSSLLGFLGGGNYSFNGGVGTTNAAGISGGRALGGPVSAGSLYRVNEKGPELLTSGGKQYLMMGANSGTVSANGSTGGVVVDQRGQTINVGQGVSRGEMVQAMQAVRAQTIHDIRRLNAQGKV